MNPDAPGLRWLPLEHVLALDAARTLDVPTIDEREALAADVEQTAARATERPASGTRRRGHRVFDRGVCPVCGVTYALTLDGHLRRHGLRARDVCPGSGARPK